MCVIETHGVWQGRSMRFEVLIVVSEDHCVLGCNAV
jgi:hypothetical protein